MELSEDFWHNTPKMGRPKLFESPEILWEKALEYFDWCKANPLITTEIYGKDATVCQVPKTRAFTWTGLECYLGIYSLREYKTNSSYGDFSQVISRIDKIIYTQKFEGAAAGIFNQNIIARDLGLVDKKQIDTIDQPQVILYLPDNGRNIEPIAQLNEGLPTLQIAPAISFEEADTIKIAEIMPTVQE